MNPHWSLSFIYLFFELPKTVIIYLFCPPELTHANLLFVSDLALN